MGLHAAAQVPCAWAEEAGCVGLGASKHSAGQTLQTHYSGTHEHPLMGLPQRADGRQSLTPFARGEPWCTREGRVCAVSGLVYLPAEKSPLCFVKFMGGKKQDHLIFSFWCFFYETRHSGDRSVSDSPL